MTQSAVHIAVIDDDPSVLQSLLRLLKSAGYDVSAYATADAFLRSPHLKDTSCLVVDIQMPGLSGLDLQDIVAALRAPIPIVFITAHRDDEVRCKALSNGAVGFLEKPFDDHALIALIEKAIAPSRNSTIARNEEARG